MTANAEIPLLVRRLLEFRGIKPAEFGRFLNPSVCELAAPEKLPGAPEAARALYDAAVGGRKIVVFGDYDCDGICATAILVKALAIVGAEVSSFLPDRLSEGYGMTEASVRRMLEENPGVRTVVTVDNGINSADFVPVLRERGIELIVTDHHLPGETLPDCITVNPRVSHPEGLEDLCGAGVALMIARLIFRLAYSNEVGKSPGVSSFIVLAGMATVTDVMPLTGQNRILVAEALRRFEKWAPVGLKELYLRASRRPGARHTSKDFGFLLGPRINAAGRIASGDDSLSLILSETRDEAAGRALKVDMCNLERKAVEQKMLDSALGQVRPGAGAQVIDLPDGHQGVAGIVAARVMERLEEKVPVCVVVEGHGSARSPEGINVRDALARCDGCLSRFGGHAAAAGFSVKEGMLEDFRLAFAAACESLRGDEGAERCEIRAFEVGPADLTLEFGSWVARFEPYGEGNPEPVFVLRGAQLRDIRTMGAEKRHLTFFADNLRAVWWNRAEELRDLTSSPSPRRDVYFTIEISGYGDPHLELRVVAME